MSSSVDTWVAELNTLNGRVLQAAQTGVGDALRLMADVLADYPPELPNQHYVRTNTLHDGWTSAQPVFDVTDTGLTGTITNTVDYVGEVEGDGSQGDIFAGRWPTDTQVMDAYASRARDLVEAAVEGVVTHG